MAVTLIVRSSSSGKATNDSPRMTFDSARIVIGRGEGCDLRLPDLSVSHRHASIRQRGVDYIVVDEGSTNGTYLGQVRLHPQAPRMIRTGEMIRVGRVWLEVVLEQAPATAQPNVATRELALALVAEAMRTQGESCHPRLVVIEGPDQGREAPFGPASAALIVGRGRDVDLALDVPESSRRHARCTRRGDQCLVRDLGSRHGTSSPLGSVPTDQDVVLRHGDTFAIGLDVIAFEHPGAEVLRDIEQADDEAMEAPPPPQPESSTAPAPAPVERASRPSLPSRASSPQLSPRPVARRKRAQASWGKTDVVIVLLALVVLGMSVVGLFWLFRTS